MKFRTVESSIIVRSIVLISSELCITEMSDSVDSAAPFLETAGEYNGCRSEIKESRRPLAGHRSRVGYRALYHVQVVEVGGPVPERGSRRAPRLGDASRISRLRSGRLARSGRTSPEITCREVAAQEQVPNSEEMVYKVVALARLVCPNANIPATTALATINMRNGRELGLMRGANVVMPNLTPPRYRRDYEIYPNKACIGESPSDCGGCLRRRIVAIGRTPGSGPGGYWQQFKPPREAFDVLERTLGERWLGTDIGEQDGRYIGGYANQMTPASAGRLGVFPMRQFRT